MSEIDFGGIIVQVFESTLRLSLPLLFAALGGLFCERSGVINIALEGMMLMGAFCAAFFAYSFHSAWLGLLGGMIGGACLALFYGLFVIQFRSNQIVAGIAINMLVFGLTPFLSKLWCGSTSSTPSVPMEARFLEAPFLLALFLYVSVYLWLKFTPSGLWLYFAGEHPKALESAGIQVSSVRWFAVMMSGVFAGIGGATLSICLSSSFSRNMTAGRGFMALAALIFGKWKPIPTAMACLLFGFVDALQIRLQGIVLWGTDPVPVQLIQVFPYFITVLVLAGAMGRSKAPRALGSPL